MAAQKKKKQNKKKQNKKEKWNFYFKEVNIKDKIYYIMDKSMILKNPEIIKMISWNIKFKLYDLELLWLDKYFLICILIIIVIIIGVCVYLYGYFLRPQLIEYMLKQLKWITWKNRLIFMWWILIYFFKWFILILKRLVKWLMRKIYRVFRILISLGKIIYKWKFENKKKIGLIEAIMIIYGSSILIDNDYLIKIFGKKPGDYELEKEIKKIEDKRIKLLYELIFNFNLKDYDNIYINKTKELKDKNYWIFDWEKIKEEKLLIMNKINNKIKLINKKTMYKKIKEMYEEKENNIDLVKKNKEIEEDFINRYDTIKNNNDDLVIYIKELKEIYDNNIKMEKKIIDLVNENDIINIISRNILEKDKKLDIYINETNKNLGVYVDVDEFELIEIFEIYENMIIEIEKEYEELLLIISNIKKKIEEILIDYKLRLYFLKKNVNIDLNIEDNINKEKKYLLLVSRTNFGKIKNMCMEILEYNYEIKNDSEFVDFMEKRITKEKMKIIKNMCNDALNSREYDDYWENIKFNYENLPSILTNLQDLNNGDLTNNIIIANDIAIKKYILLNEENIENTKRIGEKILKWALLFKEGFIDFENINIKNWEVYYLEKNKGFWWQYNYLREVLSNYKKVNNKDEYYEDEHKELMKIKIYFKEYENFQNFHKEKIEKDIYINIVKMITDYELKCGVIPSFDLFKLIT